MSGDSKNLHRLEIHDSESAVRVLGVMGRGVWSYGVLAFDGEVGGDDDDDGGTCRSMRNVRTTGEFRSKGI